MGVDIEMSINGEDADFPTGPYIVVGDDVFFEYRVTNIGDETLTDWLVEDSAIGGPACRSTSPLDPRESFTCRRGPVPAQPGQYATVATVTASNGSIRVTDEDPAHYFGIEEDPGSRLRAGLLEEPSRRVGAHTVHPMTASVRCSRALASTA